MLPAAKGSIVPLSWGQCCETDAVETVKINGFRLNQTVKLTVSGAGSESHPVKESGLEMRLSGTSQSMGCGR